MGIMNILLGKLNKKGALAVTQPKTDRLNPGEILVNNGAGPTPQNPGLFGSIEVPQLDQPNFATDEDRERSEAIKKMAKEGEKNAIAVMNNLAAADESAANVEEHFYGPYHGALNNNYKRRLTVKGADMTRLHKTRIHQANIMNRVNQTSNAANEAIAQIGKKKEEIAEGWWN